mmetsp:Transcript_25698/g.65283  ORF Transcript_25698/g.65283 Transcript_25698/m.65283 type:complete len:226 (+) Transcript_25698:341-1018(+)
MYSLRLPAPAPACGAPSLARRGACTASHLRAAVARARELPVRRVRRPGALPWRWPAIHRGEHGVLLERAAPQRGGQLPGGVEDEGANQDGHHLELHAAPHDDADADGHSHADGDLGGQRVLHARGQQAVHQDAAAIQRVRGHQQVERKQRQVHDDGTRAHGLPQAHALGLLQRQGGRPAACGGVLGQRQHAHPEANHGEVRERARYCHPHVRLGACCVPDECQAA